jgi:hypothetical protein
MKKVVCYSRIHRRSIGRFRGETAGTQASDGVKAGPLRQSEAAAFV